MSTSKFTLSTNENAAAFAVNLVPGPTWTSFEQFRTGGTTGLDGIPQHGVATLRCKNSEFKVIRDSDFQRLVGLASEVCRLQSGLKFIIQAAKVFHKHPDDDHFKLIIQSASMIASSPELPQRTGHESFQITSQELKDESSDNFDLDSADIPRPRW
jgi:hypothetical protein